ncbi:MAG: HDOD domain-containing protein [Pseudomonadales bacterium]|nr:HDOD domain-containing protein [Pseudomonadales bacterium]
MDGMALDGQKVDIPYGTKDWVNRLARKEMPALAHSVQHLGGLTASDEACVAELVKVVLEDPNLTSRIIRIANSAHYNKTGTRTNTISRAISMIGFDTIRSLCISSKVIDALLHDAPNDRLLQVVAQSFHSAMQAKALVARAKSSVQEEVFVSALLYQIGEASFWCYGGDAVTIVDAKMRIPGADKDDVVEEVIGTKFRRLSFGLAKAWRLGDTLLGALQNKPLTAGTGAVRLGHEISVATSEGWDSPKIEILVKKVAKFKKIDEEEALIELIECADKTVELAREWGADKIEDLIPSSADFEIDEYIGNTDSEEESPVGNIEKDPELQLNILRELSLMAGTKIDINLVFNMVLEGLHRGIGLDRALLALKTPGDKNILGRYMIGNLDGDIGKRFNFKINKDNIFGYLFKGCTPFWLSEQEPMETKSLVTSEIKAVLGNGEFFIAPIVVRGRSIGLFYADSRSSGRPLSREQFAAFNHFVQQVNLVLSSQ